MRFRAFVQSQWERDRAILHVRQDLPDGHALFLMQDGSWARLPNGEAPMAETGIALPQEALPALLEALGAHLGARTPSEGELLALRDTLEVERARVDAVIDSFLERKSDG